MTPRISALAALPLLLAALLVPPARSEPAEPGSGEAPAGAAEEEAPLDLRELEIHRTARRALYPVNQRISRYVGAAAKAADEGDNDKALELLRKLNPRRMNPVERAMVYQMQAFVSYGAGNPEAAIEAFEKVLAEDILPLRDDARIRFSIAQLYAGQQQWRETIAAVKQWFRYVEDPDPLAYYLLAIAHYQLDEPEEALANAEKAVDLSPAPKEGWLQLLAALYIEKEDYDRATPVLEELVLRFPKKLYWVQLSLIYGAREKYQHSLAVQQVAYLQNLLTEDKELRRLARSYLFNDLPYPAARVLEKGLADGTIEADAEAYELLANSWIAAREYDRALEPLKKAAELAEDGKLYVRLGQVYLQREEWSPAAKTFREALRKGGLEHPGNALLLLGISYYNAGQIDQARTYLARARKHDAARTQAERWLQHLENESPTAVAGPPSNPT